MMIVVIIATFSLMYCLFKALWNMEPDEDGEDWRTFD